MPLDSQNYQCHNHSGILNRIIQLEKEFLMESNRVDRIATKLNQILGGVLISPFLVALIMLLLKGTN